MGTHSEVAEMLGGMVKFILAVLVFMTGAVIFLIGLVIYLVVKG